MSYSIDANLLLYASDEGSPFYAQAHRFPQSCARREEVFCLSWTTIMAYLRISTPHLAEILKLHEVRTLYTNDADFRRFAFLDVRNPLTAP